MVELKIFDCLKVTSLPSLGKLSMLRRSSVNGLDEVKEASAETNSTLEILMIADMPGWEEWAWR
jgi:hypothetical protein